MVAVWGPASCAGAASVKAKSHMANYRIYLLEAGDFVSDVIERVLEDDHTAAMVCERLRLDRSAAEVWRGDTLVARTGASFSPFTPSPALAAVSRR